MKGIIFVIAASLLIASASAAAEDAMTIDVYPQEKTVKPGQEALFDISLQNDMGETKTFYLFVSGSPAHWVNLGYSYLEIKNGSSANVPLKFYPNNRAGSYEYEVVFQLMSYPEKQVKKKIRLNVVGEEEEIEVLESSVQKEGDAVKVDLSLISKGEKEVTIDFSVVSGSGKTISTETRTYTVDGEKNISHEIKIQKGLLAGTYKAKVVLKGIDASFESSFDVEPVHSVVKKKVETSTPLFHETKISVSNEGNVVENNYKISSTVPTGLITFYMQPDKCEGSECEWVLDGLEPKESTVITYRVEYWPLFAEGVVLVVLVALFVVFGYNKVGTPRLVKKIESGGKGAFTTVLEIKNRGRKITNVVLRDHVSPLFEVKGDFETIKPAIRHTERGTELVWSLGAIEPNDHRILHYGVKPVVSGELKVPKAHLRFVTAAGKVTRLKTRNFTVAA